MLLKERATHTQIPFSRADASYGCGSEVGWLCAVDEEEVGGWRRSWGSISSRLHQYKQFDLKCLAKFVGTWVGAGSESSPKERSRSWQGHVPLEWHWTPLGPRRWRELWPFQGRQFKAWCSQSSSPFCCSMKVVLPFNWKLSIWIYLESIKIKLIGEQTISE